MAGAVEVHGMRELQRAFAKADKDTRKEIRDAFRAAAEPVARDAETLARSGIRRITPRWAAMRVGVTTRVVYVAPKSAGTRQRGSPRSRPKFGTLLMGKAMQPALEHAEPQLLDAADNALERIADAFNRSPV